MPQTLQSPWKKKEFESFGYPSTWLEKKNNDLNETTKTY